MQYWQIAAGDTRRNFVDICLKYGVVLNGPGSYGRWTDNMREIMVADGWTSKKISDIERFLFEVKKGDVVVLRLGTSEVHGIGVIHDDYDPQHSYSDSFSDVDGWDIQHLRRVNWLWKADGVPKTYDTHTLKFGDTTQRLNLDQESRLFKDIQDVLDKQSSITSAFVLPDLPPVSEPIDKEGISRFFFEYGIGSSSIDSLKNKISDLVALAEWYRSFGKPSETETIVHLVVPLLEALGWTAQKMAFERRVSGKGRIDLALFDHAKREDNHLCAVIEVKRFDQSCIQAKDQAKNYATSYENCFRVIVTDGMRYAIYLRNNKDEPLSDHPVAYLNLLNMRKANPVYGCDGAHKALLLMSNEWRLGLEPLQKEKKEENV